MTQGSLFPFDYKVWCHRGVFLHFRQFTKYSPGKVGLCPELSWGDGKIGPIPTYCRLGLPRAADVEKALPLTIWYAADLSSSTCIRLCLISFFFCLSWIALDPTTQLHQETDVNSGN